MKYYAVSVRDRAADVFSTPTFVANLGIAIRSFSDEVNRPAENNMLYLHPEDFDLYSIGRYNDETGDYEPTPPQQICVGKDCVKQQKEIK